MKTIEEKYEFEISEEVKEKIEHAENRHVLIREDALNDLEPIRLSCKGYLFFKRLADIVLSFCGLLVLLLPMLILSIAVFVDDPGKVFFRQYRVGRNGKRFRLYKFRTMKRIPPSIFLPWRWTTPINILLGLDISFVGHRWMRFLN